MRLTRRKGSGVAGMAAVALAATLAMTSPAHAGSSIQVPDGQFLSGNSKTNCVYPATDQNVLAAFSSAVGQNINCVVLFNNAKPTWSDWTTPWFASPPWPSMNMVNWKNAAPGRRIIISQPMVPDSAPSTWRVLGAQGAYDQYATQLAKNLVSLGIGDSIIRLGWEANDGADQDSTLGSDSSQWSDWAIYWARIAWAMRAVPGAHFQFDWTVNQYWQPIPLSSWYPGDDVVNIIGIDAYDSGISNASLTPTQRWNQLVNEPDGLNAVAEFAAAHGKPMSIPEWGLIPSGAATGGGDDPTYVAGLATFIRNHNVIYDSYFLHGPGVILLPNAPNSLAAYRQDFVFGTTATTSNPGSTSASEVLTTTAAGVVSTLTPLGKRSRAAELPRLTKPIVGMAATRDDNGYWLVVSDGGIFSFGDARFFGSTGNIRLNKPIVGMAATPDGHGYWLVASDGGIFSFGDARFFGSTGNIRLNKPIVGMAATPDGHGYWLVVSDGGIFSFGDARFFGSTGNVRLNKAITGMAVSPKGSGYRLLGADGGIFTFGRAQFEGAQVPGTAVSLIDDGADGYWIVSSTGQVTAFGSAWRPAGTGAGEVAGTA